MTQQRPNTDADGSVRPAAKRGLEPWFAYTVGLLLLAVIAALTGLSLRFHARALRAQVQLHDMRGNLDKAESALSIFGANVAELTPRLDRQSLRRTTVTLDGRPVEVMELSAGVGRTLGLEAGDILRVGPGADPAGSPATRAAGAGGN